MSDLIDRQSAIEAMWKALYAYEDLTEKQFMEHEELELGDWFKHRIFVQRMHEECMKAVNSLPSATSQNLTKPNKTSEEDLISRQDALDAFGCSEKTRKYGGDHSGYDTRMIYEIQDELESLPSAPDSRQRGEWIPVSDIRKLEDILLMKINSFEGTRNIVEKGMLEVWKEVAEYIDGMLGEAVRMNEQY